MHGFIVSWDVDSRDMSLSSRLRRFVHGYNIRRNGKSYHYPGLVDREKTLHLGQSVLFLSAEDFPALKEFLSSNGIRHEVTEAWIGPAPPD